MAELSATEVATLRKKVDDRRNQVINYAYFAYDILFTLGKEISREGTREKIETKRRLNDFNGFNLFGIFGQEAKSGYAIEVYYVGQMVLSFYRRGRDHELIINAYVENFPPGDQVPWQTRLDYTIAHKAEIITAIESGGAGVLAGTDPLIDIDDEVGPGSLELESLLAEAKRLRIIV